MIELKHKSAGRKDMVEKTIIYGKTNLGLLFVPESRAKELAESNKALLTAKTWGEFKALVSLEMYVFYACNSDHYEGPFDPIFDPEDEDYNFYDIPQETPFTPNDVVTYDVLPAYPEIEMSEWMPEEIQVKYGRKTRYSAMDMNVPDGDILVLKEKQTDEIVTELEILGYECHRDDDLLMAGTALDFDPDDYPGVDDNEEEEDGVPNENSLPTDELRRGTWVQLSNGWFAILMDNNKGSVRLAEVQGEYVEIGPIRSRDIVKAKINGEWVEITHKFEKSGPNSKSVDEEAKGD
jgi:hypothetical protein